MFVLGSFSEVKDSIVKVLSGRKVFIIGVGSDLRGDDYVGSYVASNLRLRGLNNVIDAGLSPESFLGIAVNARPEVVVFIDAVKAGLNPGFLVFGSLKEIEELEVVFPTTHKPSYSMLRKYLEYMLPKADQYLLGIQVSDISFGSPMTSNVKRTADILVKFLSTLLQ